jgi:hypothetical protein
MVGEGGGPAEEAIRAGWSGEAARCGADHGWWEAAVRPAVGGWFWRKKIRLVKRKTIKVRIKMLVSRGQVTLGCAAPGGFDQGDT